MKKKKKKVWLSRLGESNLWLESCDSAKLAISMTQLNLAQAEIKVRLRADLSRVVATLSRATDNSILHPNFVKRMGIGQQELDKPKNIYNIDNTTNKAGQITHYLNLAVTTGGTMQEMWFLVTDIGREDVLLGIHGCLPMNLVSAGGMARSTKLTSPSYYRPSSQIPPKM